jgi:vacuolar protein-sorting-associated protein 4
LLFLNQSKVASDNIGEGDVVIVAATNRLEDLDEAVVRRFETKIYVNTLSKVDRELFLKTQLSSVGHNLATEDLRRLATKTEGWSGADLEMLCREAGMRKTSLDLQSRKILRFY